MGVIKEQLGLKSLGAYLVAVIGTAIAAGLLLNAAYASFAWPLQLSMAEHGDSYPALASACRHCVSRADSAGLGPALSSRIVTS
jgi:hypothetical protein